MNKEQLKAKLHKWFPKDKDMTEKQLVKQRKSYLWMQWVSLAEILLFASLMAFGPKDASVLQRIAFTGLIVGGIAGGLAVYAQYRVLEVEVNFELRLREAIATLQSKA